MIDRDEVLQQHTNVVLNKVLNRAKPSAPLLSRSGLGLALVWKHDEVLDQTPSDPEFSQSARYKRFHERGDNLAFVYVV